MSYKNLTNVGDSNINNPLVMTSSAVFIILFLILGGLFQTLFAISEPIVTDNLNGSFTAHWPLENTTDFNLYNLTMQNGAVNLTLDDFWWNQTSQSEFETGSLLNIDSSTFPDDLMLNSTSFGISQNYIKNGRFVSSANWSFDGSDNITSERNVGGEYGWMHHYSASNPILTEMHNVSSGNSDGDNGGSAATDAVDGLQYWNDGKYWHLDQNEYINISGFDVLGRTGKIIRVVLWANLSRDPSRWDGNNTLEYKNESGKFIQTSIAPPLSGVWENQSHDLTDGYTSWTWIDIANLELNFTNNDVNPQDNWVRWDRIWLEVTVERLEQSSYINQTFEVLNTTGFNDTSYDDFSKSLENNNVNFTLSPDNVILDTSGYTFEQISLYANNTGGAATYIYKGSPFDQANYGGNADIWAGDSVGWSRSLIKFNFSAIPYEAIILDANLSLWVEYVNVEDIPVEVHRITMDWDEGTTSNPATDGATWLSADTNPLIDWLDGGEFDPFVYNETTIPFATTDVWYRFNVTLLTREWMNGTPNHGLLLKDSVDGSTRNVRFTSDDGVNTSRLPKLIVTYTLPNYLTYGNFSSQVFDAEKVVDSWGNIRWTGDTPPGTTIAIETRSGDTPVPGASWESWSGNYSQPGDAITSGLSQYIQYRAHLQTTDINISPELYDVTIIFESTNLTFDYLVETAQNPTVAEMSILINDTEIWKYNASLTSPWSNDSVDISEWILSKGLHNISLRFHLEIETNSSVNCSVGYDNLLIGALSNETRGEYISMGFDAGSQAIWDEMSWNATVSSETEVVIQTRSSPDNTSWGVWSASYLMPGGDSITSVNDRYIQYRAVLITRNETISPILHDVNISYHKYRVNGTLEMKNDYVPAAVTNWGLFTNTSNFNGQSVEFWYSTDSGGSWDQMPSGGDMGGVDTSSGTIRFRAEFSTTNTSFSPELLHFSLLYFTNNPPQLMNIGYTNEPGALGGGWFNFTVMYLDEENSYPAPLKVHITGPVVYNLTMNDLDASDINLTDGKWFYYNLTLPKGSYQYRIVASDGAIWNITSFSSFTVNNNPPELRYINVWPPTDPGGTSFNFTVVYFDGDNDPPDALLPVNLTINGPVSYNVTMTELDPSDTIYTDGKEFYYSIVLAEGTYNYFITAYDGEDWTMTGTYPLTVTNNPPVLNAPSVLPSSGYNTTTFNFTVNYSDSDDDAPGMVTLNLSGPSMMGSYIMMEVDPGDTTYTDGKLYYIPLTGFTKGLYTHHFAASDSDGYWTETGEIALPVVLNSEPQIVTSNTEFADEDAAYSAQYQFSDADGDSCVWLLNTNASWLAINPTTGYLNGTPDNGDVGWFWVNVTVSDNDGGLNWTQFILTVNNTLPQITTTSPTQWAVEGYLYTFDFEGDDEGQGNAYWTRDSNASWLSINDSTGELTGSPRTSDIGSFWVNVTLYDGNGGFDVLNYTIWVNDTSSPIADAGLDAVTWVGMLIGFDGSGSTDNSGEIANYTWYFGDFGVGYGVAPTHVYWSKGVLVVTLIVTDHSGNQAMDTKIVTVLNTPPQIFNGNIIYADEDNLYSVHYQYFDIDVDICIWILDTNASWLAINPTTGYLNGTPDNGDVGWFWVNVTVSDNDGGLNWTLFVVTVNNTRPMITTTSPTQWAVEGYLYSFDFEGDDEGQGNAYWTRDSNASWLSINDSTGELTGIPITSDIGSFWVNVTLFDGNGGFDFLNYTIWVNDTSSPIADAGLDAVTWVGMLIGFDGSGSTDNSGEIANYTWYFGDFGVGYGVAPTHVYWSKGVFVVTLVVTDPSGNQAMDTKIVTVLNTAPQILTGNIIYANEDTLYSVHYQYFDIDVDICSWILDTNASWLAINPTTGYLNGTPDNGDVGTFWVNVTVNDNDGGLTLTSFILTVNNTKPKITTTSPTQWATEGQQYTFEFNGEDEGEGGASWSLQTNASWLSIDGSTGLLSGTPGNLDVTWFWVNVTLNDGNGGYDYLDFTITVNDVSSPAANTGADDIAWEDSPYIFDGSGSSDNSGVIANFTWYFGDGGMGYGVSPSHLYTNQGVYLVVLLATDETGNQGFDTMEITVLNVDPVADAGPDKTGNEGEPVSFDASSSYDTPSDDAGLVYLWDFDFDGEFDDGFGIASTYTWYDEGTFVAGLKVIDDNGNFSTDFVNVTINNLPPAVSLEDSYSGMEGDPIYFLATATDSGRDQLFYRWDWDNDGLNDTQWSNKPYANNSWALFGTYTINVEVWDGDDGFSSTTANVAVIRPEQPPVISGVGGRYVRFGYPFILDLDPYITDPDTPKDDLTVTTSESTYIDVNGLILTLTYPQSMLGDTRVVTISVSDGKNMDNDTLTVTITDNFPPEVSGDIPDVSFDEGETLDSVYDLDNYFTDKDGDPLDYTLVGNVHVRPVINPSTHAISFSTDPNWYGVEDITIRAYDPKGAFVEQVVRVTVNPVNFPPTIGGIQDVYIRPNSPWELRILDPVYVWDDDSILDLNIFTNSPFVTSSPTKEGVLVFYYLDPSISTDIVQISVSDGEFTASTDVVVHISITNWPPYIKDYTYPSDVRFDEDTQLPDHFDLNDYFADNTSDVLTFTQIVPESNLIVTIDGQGRVSFSAAENWFGVTTVTFRAQDAAGAWASFTINVTVSPVNDPPEILSSITYVRIDQDEIWVIDLNDYFSDLESGDNLTFSSNKASIKIDPVTHEARWERNGKESLDGLLFTASDGEDSVSTEPVNLKVVGTFNWLWVIMAAGLGALGVFVYRGLRYRYRIDEVLLVDHAGILLSHLSRGKSRVAVDAELVSGMLTAVQDFVKDSFLRGEMDEEILRDKKKSLEKLEFAGHHLIMEQGKYSFMCAVISGTVNKRLRKRMRDVLGEFETEYDEILSDWDGVIERFAGTEEILKKLIPKGEKPPKIDYPIEELELGKARSYVMEESETEEESPADDFEEEDLFEHVD